MVSVVSHIQCCSQRFSSYALDYADSHKNDAWQRYASATAAAFTKELLTYVPLSEVSSSEQAVVRLNNSSVSQMDDTAVLTSPQAFSSQVGTDSGLSTLNDSLRSLRLAESTDLRRQFFAIVDAGGDLNIKKGEKQYALLHGAVAAQDSELVKELLAQKAYVEVRNWVQGTPLMMAAHNGYTSIVSLLLDAGANVDAIQDVKGWRALHFAASAGHFEVVQRLIDWRANLEAQATDLKRRPVEKCDSS